MRLKEDDRLVAVLPVKGDEEIIMGTRKGMAIRFSIDDDNVRPLSVPRPVSTACVSKKGMMW